MTWVRSSFPVANLEIGKPELVPARGFANHLFGIRFEGGIGFRVTHLNSGYLISRSFFKRLKDAVAFCEAITDVADWASLTAEAVSGRHVELVPHITAAAQRYERFVIVSGPRLLRLHAEPDH